MISFLGKILISALEYLKTSLKLTYINDLNPNLLDISH
jgi:hypothetical protein